MENLNGLIKKHITPINKQLCFKDITGLSLQEWIEPILFSITDEGAIPYLTEDKSRYRASPLSSSLIWLNAIDLLPTEVISVMNDKLIYLRDNIEKEDSDPGLNVKQKEDREGWSVGEGVSVWSTSLAIIALLENQNDCDVLKHIDLLKESVRWLIKQQNYNEHGWAYSAL